MSQERAFVLRIKPSGVDRVKEALKTGDIIIGWSGADGLDDLSLDWYGFRQIIHDAHYPDEEDYRKSGRAAGEMWRFVREMEGGSLIVVPYGSDFFVAEVTGRFRVEENQIEQDTAHRRAVNWLNDGRAIPRHQAPAQLYSRMKIRGTSADASDLIPEIRAVLARQAAGERATFDSDLHKKLISATVERLRRGFVNEREFERIIAEALRKMGAQPVRVVDNRRYDQGADVIASFRIGRTTEIVLAVQAKFYKPDPPVTPEWLDQLRDGMVAENADLGWLVSTGTFSDAVERRRQQLLEDEGVRVDLIDAEDLATMMLENGISPPMGD